MSNGLRHDGDRVADIGGRGSSKGDGAKSDGAARKAAIKYRDSAGNTWSGPGLKPKWLSQALGAGRKLEDFKV